MDRADADPEEVVDRPLVAFRVLPRNGSSIHSDPRSPSEFFREEFAKHLPQLRRRTGLTERDARELVDSLGAYLTVIPQEALLPALERAAAAMGAIDSKDTDYLAAALATECEGIWSDDPHFKRQRVVARWTTKELVAGLREHGVQL